jgi:hypothetical protein
MVGFYHLAPSLRPVMLAEARIQAGESSDCNPEPRFRGRDENGASLR